ncbi:MAG: hypothetical protein ACO3EK_19060, partial [Alphaproteobacteria bacterium]
HVGAYDVLLNAASAALDVTIDTQGPVANVLVGDDRFVSFGEADGPVTLSVTTGEQQLVSVTAFLDADGDGEKDAGEDEIALTEGDEPGTLTFSAASVANGDQVGVVVTSVDAAGNESVDSVSLLVETTTLRIDAAPVFSLDGGVPSVTHGGTTQALAGIQFVQQVTDGVEATRHVVVGGFTSLSAAIAAAGTGDVLVKLGTLEISGASYQAFVQKDLSVLDGDTAVARLTRSELQALDADGMAALKAAGIDRLETTVSSSIWREFAAAVADDAPALGTSIVLADFAVIGTDPDLQPSAFRSIADAIGSAGAGTIVARSVASGTGVGVAPGSYQVTAGQVDLMLFKGAVFRDLDDVTLSASTQDILRLVAGDGLATLREDLGVDAILAVVPQGIAATATVAQVALLVQAVDNAGDLSFAIADTLAAIQAARASGAFDDVDIDP